MSRRCLAKKWLSNCWQWDATLLATYLLYLIFEFFDWPVKWFMWYSHSSNLFVCHVFGRINIRWQKLSTMCIITCVYWNFFAIMEYCLRKNIWGLWYASRGKFLQRIILCCKHMPEPPFIIVWEMLFISINQDLDSAPNFWW